MKQNKIFICIACNYPALPMEFVVSMFRIIDYFYDWCKKKSRDDTISMVIHGGYCLDEMRTDVTELALKEGATHLLFLDTDLIHPPETVVWMMEDLEENADLKVEAITGVYHWKSSPYHPYLYPVWDENDKTFTGLISFPVDTLFRVMASGAGIFMVKREVVEKIPKPWFKFVKPNTLPELPKGIGEDLYFFWKCKPLMLCDSRIKCLHYKNLGIGIETYLSSNKLEIKDGWITGDKKNIDEVVKKANIKAKKGVEEWSKKV